MKRQQQQQVTINAYTMEVIQKSFVNTLRWLELYIEKSGYSDNWQRQIAEPIKRQDLTQPSEIKGFMETALLALDGVIEDKPDFLLKNLQEQFYSWLDKSGIRADDCPKELAECLINIYKVLNNEGEELVERVDREASEDIAKMTHEERRKNFYQTFTIAQRLMDGARARKKTLEGKTYKDVEIRSQFFGDHDQGKKFFSQIKGQHQASPSTSYIGSLTNLEIIQNVKSNPQNWRTDEVITDYDNFGRATRKELALIHNSAEVGHDGAVYDWQQPIYLSERFRQKEIEEIEQALNISQNNQQSQHQAQQEQPYSYKY